LLSLLLPSDELAWVATQLCGIGVLGCWVVVVFEQAVRQAELREPE
jgi:hypothetical protein